MRILQLHSDFIEYRPIKKEIPSAEECKEETSRIEELVVLFTCVEKGDSPQTAREAIDQVKGYLDQVKVNRILLYPYAHLSGELASPSDALSILKEMEAYAKEKGIETYRAPFGWCKQFSISIKGHPLAEQFKTISSGVKREAEVVSKALEAEEKLRSYWYILKPDGDLIPVDEFNFTGHENLKKFAEYEISKVRAVQQVPPHVNIMKRLELADYEPASDSGNFRWYPKGRLVKSLIERYVTEKVIAYGGMEVETPVMYDLEHPSLASYLHRFPARQYILKSDDKEFFLRFSACFGQFLLAHDAQISYRQLPLKIYELTRYSFRREKSGELAGLRRLRSFTMPDCHALCADINQAKEEFVRRFRLSLETLEGLELTRDDCELAIRFTKDFYKDNRDFIVSIVKIFGKPALVEMWEERFFYFILKWEINFVDSLGKASALSTDQIDIENGARYGITFVDEKGEKVNPLILHCSPSGAIERDIYAILEKAYMDQQNGKAPMLPLWLSPTQVRIIPVSEEFYGDAESIAIRISEESIRADWDDRQMTMQKKVREAEMEWIPYIVVVGKREVETGNLAVRDRRLSRAGQSSRIRMMKLEDLIAEIKSITKGKPFMPLSLPMAVSKRPRFYG
ncbi:MAG: threonine--tRNA ligase [Nitrososphaerota archaeon]|nr:threonine--tRNA ligase [Candidatus Bathyarchaeota archaeon]MDW8049007.1 threonine--tRNA ligase [Nitrososphaerota archaeon]